MTEMVAKYCVASQAGENVIAAHVLRWFRAEYDSSTEVKKALGVRYMVGDTDLRRHLMLLTKLTQIAGFRGLIVVFDEISVLTRSVYGAACKGNQDAFLNLLNDASRGTLTGLGFFLAGTRDALDSGQRGFFASKSLDSRVGQQLPDDLSSGGVIVSVPRLNAEQIFLMLQKVRRIRLPEEFWIERLPDTALETLPAKIMGRMGAPEGGLTPREILRRQEQLIVRLENDPSLTWEKALTSSAEINQPTQQRTSNSRSEALRKLKL